MEDKTVSEQEAKAEVKSRYAPRGREEPSRGRSETRRETRVPFGAPGAKLTSPDDPNYKFRFFNDNWRHDPNRIMRAQRAGYEVVEGWESPPAGTNEDGSGIRAVLMKLPKDLYDADQALKQKEIDKVDQEIHRGDLNSKASDKRYVPKNGIKISTSARSEDE